MENGTYILIKEATKKYGKTRQTFYNYMRKGLIQTKKVGNKVYMSVHDIERIFGNYLAPSAEEIVQTQTSQSIIDATYTHEIRVEALEKQVDDIQKSLYDIPQRDESKHDTELLFSKLQAQLITLQEYAQNIYSKVALEKKKRLFAWGYAAFIALNCIILSFL